MRHVIGVRRSIVLNIYSLGMISQVTIRVSTDKKMEVTNLPHRFVTRPNPGRHSEYRSTIRTMSYCEELLQYMLLANRIDSQLFWFGWRCALSPHTWAVFAVLNLNRLLIGASPFSCFQTLTVLKATQYVHISLLVSRNISRFGNRTECTQ